MAPIQNLQGLTSTDCPAPAPAPIFPSPLRPHEPRPPPSGAPLSHLTPPTPLARLPASKNPPPPDDWTSENLRRICSHRDTRPSGPTANGLAAPPSAVPRPARSPRRSTCERDKNKHPALDWNGWNQRVTQASKSRPSGEGGVVCGRVEGRDRHGGRRLKKKKKSNLCP